MKYSVPKSGQKGSLEIVIVDSSLIHAKMYVADDEFAAVGFANLTRADMWDNVENIMTYDGAEVGSIRKEFEKIWKHNGKGIANGKEKGYWTNRSCESLAPLTASKSPSLESSASST